tara:strand:- start:438 stop:788 length:351 start_codon:yes stop_codon:yes gene_type:complete
MKRRHKYNAKKTAVDGIAFDSKREAKRYVELKLLEKAGEIFGLTLQPTFRFRISGNAVLIRSKGYPSGRQASYRADFRYVRDGQDVIEDVKGVRTPLYKLKKAMVEAQYGVRVEEV